MGETTEISWCDATGGPWLICTEVSPGCAHCYARTLMEQRMKTIVRKAYRSAGFSDWETRPIWGKSAPRVLTKGFWSGAIAMDRKAAKENRRVRWFPSLIDWLDDMPAGIIDQDGNWLNPIAVLSDFLDTIRLTPNIDWLLLTKRPEHFRARLEKVLEIIPRTGLELNHAMLRSRIEIMMNGWAGYSYIAPGIGIENYWIGTTVEDQQRADERIPHLLSIPAKVRFLSCEPLLGPVTLPIHHQSMGPSKAEFDWVIVGGESGPGFRPFDPKWARSLRDQCQDTDNVAFHMKQMGGLKPSMMPPIPQDLMIREYP